MVGFWRATVTTSCFTRTRAAVASCRASRCCASRDRRDKPNLCLADSVAPVGSGVADSIGAFAVTLEADDLAETLSDANFLTLVYRCNSKDDAGRSIS